MLRETMPSVEQAPETNMESLAERNTSSVPAVPHSSGNGVNVLAKEIVALRQNQELLKAEIAEQREYLLHIISQLKKIRRYILMNTVGEVLKLFLIFLPLIAAYFALRPYLGQVGEGLKNLQSTFSELGWF